MEITHVNKKKMYLQQALHRKSIKDMRRVDSCVVGVYYILEVSNYRIGGIKIISCTVCFLSPIFIQEELIV